jgi:hypothetical protein
MTAGVVGVGLSAAAVVGVIVVVVAIRATDASHHDRPVEVAHRMAAMVARECGTAPSLFEVVVDQVIPASEQGPPDHILERLVSDPKRLPATRT